MKAVIIGGGIAGLSCGVLLHNAGVDVVVSEKEMDIPTRGNAFLMHSDGLSILKKFLNIKTIESIPGQEINSFILKRPDETTIKYQKLEPWQCIKRKDILQFLYEAFPSSKIKTSRVFSHFIYEHDKAIAVVFKNGEKEYGDVFIGADGANSAIRQSIFGKTAFLNNEVKEVVGGIKLTGSILPTPNTFTKYLSKKEGVSFGFIPTSEKEIVWFMQYDSALYTVNDEKPETIKELCNNLLHDFPAITKEIIQQNDFSTSYLWHAKDFDSLPRFHDKNIVLIGDAAHLALPFTSAGTTNALMDASSLVKYLIESENIETAFQQYYDERITLINDHLQLGRELKNKFLHTQTEIEDEIKIPLIKHKQSNNLIGPKYKRVSLLYFTDPICSTCWTIQPQLRKLKLEYENYIEIEYCMAGLLPSWDHFNRGGIQTPMDAYIHWKEVSENQEMPISPDVWKDDPLPSSYPPSIAFKAAQMQDTDKAIIFLRRINELLFLENKNIVENALLHKAAFESGLDAARLMRDLAGKAQMLFEADLALARSLNISILPTFIFTDKFDNSKILQGFQEYEDFEKMLLHFIPEAKKSLIVKNYNKLFQKYPTLTTKEFCFLTDYNSIDAINILENLNSKSIISKCQLKNNDIIWKINEDYA